MHLPSTFRQRLAMMFLLPCLTLCLPACTTSLRNLMPAAAPSGPGGEELERIGDSMRERGELQMLSLIHISEPTRPY